jgi:hypothetical protein
LVRGQDDHPGAIDHHGGGHGRDDSPIVNPGHDVGDDFGSDPVEQNQGGPGNAHQDREPERPNVHNHFIIGGPGHHRHRPRRHPGRITPDSRHA